jgi:hypothetical protein
MANESVPVDGEIVQEIQKWEDTFEEAVKILTQAVPVRSESLVTSEQKRMFLLKVCRRVADVAVSPVLSAKYKAMESKAAQSERELSALKDRCHAMSESLQHTLAKTVDARGAREVVSERLKLIDAMLTDQISEQRRHLVQHPKKGVSQPGMPRVITANALLSPSFRTELERERAGDNTEVTPGIFDTPVALPKKDPEPPNRKKALPFGNRKGGRRKNSREG